MNNRSFYLVALAALALSAIFFASPETFDAAYALLLGSSDASAPVATMMMGGWVGLNFHNLERFPENEADLAPNTHNPATVIALNKCINAQSDRLEALFAEIAVNAADPKHSTTTFGYADIMPWRERQRYQKRCAAAKAEDRQMKREALAEAKEFDADEEFVEGFENFLATEFKDAEGE